MASALYSADLTGDRIPKEPIEQAYDAWETGYPSQKCCCFHPAPTELVTMSLIQCHADINYIVMHMVTQAAMKRLVIQNRGGSIVTISSNTAVSGASGQAHYAGMIASSLAMMDNFAVEFGSLGIRYNYGHRLCQGPEAEQDMVLVSCTGRYCRKAGVLCLRSS
jgi:NAD(P)-dependent dehydrogenase (short-subunit alcohol dehydrogenase family)